MKTKVVNFDPRNGFADDILSGKKAQTIRDKPIEVGQKIVLWEKYRGMKKGYYCDYCCEVVILPRKLLNTTIKECVPIEMKLRINAGASVPYITIRDVRHADKGGYSFFANDKQHLFVKADTPSWTNKQFIDFFLKYDPKIKTEWRKKYIWKW